VTSLTLPSICYIWRTNLPFGLPENRKMDIKKVKIRLEEEVEEEEEVAAEVR
jgi:hypothetical protein